MNADFNDIIQLLTHLNSGERKRLKKYTLIWNDQTKEKLLFDAFESAENSEVKKQRLLNKLGYSHSNQRSFRKFTHSVKKRMHDFFISSNNIEHIKHTDPYIHQKSLTKKMILTAMFFFQKGLYEESKKVLHDAQLLAIKNESFEEHIEILSLKREIAMNEHSFQQVSKYEKAMHAKREDLKALDLASKTINALLIEMKLCNSISQELLNYQSHLLSCLFNAKASVRIQFYVDYAKAVHLQLQNKFNDSLSILFSLRRMIAQKSTTFPSRYKVLVYLKIAENLTFLDRSRLLLKRFQTNSLIATIPSYQTVDLQLFKSWFLFHFESSEKAIQHFSNAANYNHLFSVDLASQIILAHLLFRQKKYKDSLTLIDQIKITKNDSICLKLDVKLIELMCLIELANFDLADYKTDAFYITLSRINEKIDVRKYTFAKSILLDLRKIGYQFTKLNEQKKKLIDLFCQDVTPKNLRDFYHIQPAFFIQWMKSNLYAPPKKVASQVLLSNKVIGN